MLPLILNGCISKFRRLKLKTILCQRIYIFYANYFTLIANLSNSREQVNAYVVTQIRVIGSTEEIKKQGGNY